MADLRADILEALKATYNEDPSRYTFVSSILSNLGIPYDLEVSRVFIDLQKSGFIEVMPTTNIRVRLTPAGATRA
jgi:hypothetical protein